LGSINFALRIAWILDAISAEKTHRFLAGKGEEAAK
jgi:hypothetical protein